MPTESIQAKAQRLLSAGAVTVDGPHTARVAGDSGQRYVCASWDDGERSCSCPANVECSHLLAAEMALPQRRDDSDDRLAQASSSLPQPLDPFRLGETLAASGYFPDARKAAQAVVKILAGAELGIPPIASMSKIHIMDGKPTLGADALAMLLARHAHYGYRIVEHTEETCQIELLRGGEALGKSEFTMADAERAGLVKGKSGWERYPKAMLFARALSQGVRWFCPDLTLGGSVYVEGEIEDQPAKRRRKPPPVIEATVSEPPEPEQVEYEPAKPEPPANEYQLLIDRLQEIRRSDPSASGALGERLLELGWDRSRIGEWLDDDRAAALWQWCSERESGS